LSPVEGGTFEVGPAYLELKIKQKEVVMHIKFMKWFAAAMLLMGGVGLFDSGFLIVLKIVVCIAALMVFAQALTDKRWVWAAVFFALAITYNPVAPILFSKRIFLWLDLMGMMTFLLSLVALKQRPRLSLVSITNQQVRPDSL
jgi:hypothetical protein